MAEGGFDDEVPLMRHTDDNADGDGQGERTFPFGDDYPPAARSTPKHPPIEIQTMRHELPDVPDTSFDETNFGGTTSTEGFEQPYHGDIGYNSNRSSEQYFVREMNAFIKSRYPNFQIGSLVIRYSKKILNTIVVVGPWGGEYKMLLDNSTDFTKDFFKPKFIKDALGDPAEKVIKKTSADLQKKQKVIETARKKEEEEKKDLEKWTTRYWN